MTQIIIRNLFVCYWWRTSGSERQSERVNIRFREARSHNLKYCVEMGRGYLNLTQNAIPFLDKNMAFRFFYYV